MRTFKQVDQELYDHERPLYSHATTGAGSNPTEDLEWVKRREALMKEWYLLHPDAHKWDKNEEFLKEPLFSVDLDKYEFAFIITVTVIIISAIMYFV